MHASSGVWTCGDCAVSKYIINYAFASQLNCFTELRSLLVIHTHDNAKLFAYLLFRCGDLWHFCGDGRHGAAVQRLCPASCGLCPYIIDQPEAAPTQGGANLTWPPLHFKNLPGALDRAPGWNSPYHYRLDWEVR